MKTLSKIWSVIEKHRFSVCVPLLGVILWVVVSFSCVPTTESPIQAGMQLNAAELQHEYETWVAQNEIIAKRYEWAVADIKEQQEQFSKLTTLLLSIASGSVTSWAGLLQMLASGGLVGFAADHIRKNGVIAGLKRNGTTG